MANKDRPDVQRGYFENDDPMLPYYEASEYEPSPLFDGRRQSQNVFDARSQPRGLTDYLSEYEYKTRGDDPFRTPQLLEQQDNRHTRAVDALVERLQSYQAPSRQQLLAPSKIDVPDMAKYYNPQPDPVDWRAARRSLVEEILRGPLASSSPAGTSEE
jgi:hypothetical protein